MNITGPQSIFTLLFTPSIYFQSFTFISTFYLCVWSFVNDKAGGIDNSSELVGSKVICFVQVQVKLTTSRLWTAPLFALPPIVFIAESYWRQTLVSLLREITATLHLKPSTWGNQRGARSHQANFWRHCRGLKGGTSTRVLTTANFWRRCQTPVSKIGELHTIFYLCFLVLLVYFTVFTFVFLIKNTKNTCCYYGFQWKH